MSKQIKNEICKNCGCEVLTHIGAIHFCSVIKDIPCDHHKAITHCKECGEELTLATTHQFTKGYDKGLLTGAKREKARLVEEVKTMKNKCPDGFEVCHEKHSEYSAALDEVIKIISK